MTRRSVVIVALLSACGRSNPPPVPTSTEPERHVAPVPLSSASSHAGAAATTAAPSVPGSAIPAASALPVVRRGTTPSWSGTGFISGLRLDADTVTYCDRRGSRSLNLVSGVESAGDGKCPGSDERNGVCAGIDFIDGVRAPDHDDIIDLTDGPSIPVHGLIQDCAFNNGILLIGTGQEVVAVDVKADHQVVKGEGAAEMVAINQRWLSWSDMEKVFAERR